MNAVIGARRHRNRRATAASTEAMAEAEPDGHQRELQVLDGGVAQLWRVPSPEEHPLPPDDRVRGLRVDAESADAHDRPRSRGRPRRRPTAAQRNRRSCRIVVTQPVPGG